MYGSVKVWQEIISLPTWTTGAEDPNPMFLEKRVYQGSSGSVYPYGVIDTLTGEYRLLRADILHDVGASPGHNCADLLDRFPIPHSPLQHAQPPTTCRH